jgi:hypothetical protein
MHVECLAPVRLPQLKRRGAASYPETFVVVRADEPRQVRDATGKAETTLW